MSCDVWPVYTIRFHFSICLPCDHHTHDDQGSNRVWAILSLFKRFTFLVLFQFIKNIAEKTEGKGPSPRHTIKRLTPKQHIFSSELTPRAISKQRVRCRGGAVGGGGGCVRGKAAALVPKGNDLLPIGTACDCLLLINPRSHHERPDPRLCYEPDDAA